MYFLYFLSQWPRQSPWNKQNTTAARRPTIKLNLPFDTTLRTASVLLCTWTEPYNRKGRRVVCQGTHTQRNAESLLCTNCIVSLRSHLPPFLLYDAGLYELLFLCLFSFAAVRWCFFPGGQDPRAADRRWDRWNNNKAAGSVVMQDLGLCCRRHTILPLQWRWCMRHHDFWSATDTG